MLPALIAGATRLATAASSTAELVGASSAASSIGNLSDKLDQLHGVANTATPSVQKFTSALGLLVSAVDKAARPIEDLVRVANPAQADAYQRAIRDAYGVLGRQLIPEMQAFVGVARRVGDAMAGLEGTFKPVHDAMARLIDTGGKALTEAIQQNSASFQTLAATLKLVTESTEGYIQVLRELNRVNAIGPGYLKHVNPGGIVGITKLFEKPFDPNASGVGAAARQAQFIQPKQLSDDMIKNALNMGVGAKKSDNSALNSIDGTLKEIYGDIKAWLRRRESANVVAANVNPITSVWRGLSKVMGR